MKFTLCSPATLANTSQTLLIHVSNLQAITKQNMLKFIQKYIDTNTHGIPINIVTVNPRNYYIDSLISKNYELLYEQDDESEDTTMKKRHKLIQLPINFEVVFQAPQYKIQSFTLVNLSFFQIRQKIGQGTFGEIFIVEAKYDKRLYSLKKINKTMCKAHGSINMIKNELYALQLPSKYKVKLYYAFQDSYYAYFILDYCPFGDLNSIIRYNKKMDESERMTLTEKYAIWIQIAFGIVSLHERQIIYRDLKPQNILINQLGQVRICDFGYSLEMDPNKKLNQICGSYEYLAPEMLKKEGYDQSIDLYCLGLLFYELLLGVNPFDGITKQNLSQMKNKQISFDKKPPLELLVKDLIRKLLKEKPEQRLGSAKSMSLFKHEFFKDNEDLIEKIINKKWRISRGLRFQMPSKIQLKVQESKKQEHVFPVGGYNYLNPTFNVLENIGPKFNFNF